MFIVEKKNAGTDLAPIYTDSYLMSRACFQHQCGYIGRKLRLGGANFEMEQNSRWSIKSVCCTSENPLVCDGGASLYSTAISGALSYVRFVTQSKLVRMSDSMMSY